MDNQSCNPHGPLCDCGNPNRQRSLDYADAGEWEEFYQKRGNYFMAAYWKERRLKLEKA